MTSTNRAKAHPATPAIGHWKRAETVTATISAPTESREATTSGVACVGCGLSADSISIRADNSAICVCVTSWAARKGARAVCGLSMASGMDMAFCVRSGRSCGRSGVSVGRMAGITSGSLSGVDISANKADRVSPGLACSRERIA